MNTAAPGAAGVSIHQPRPGGVYAATWAVLATIAIVLVGGGLLGSLLGVRGALEGFSATTIGVIGSAYYAGFLIGALAGPALVQRVGHIRVYAALASVAATTALVFPVAVDPRVWALSRFVGGLCFSGLFVVAESWLSSVSTSTNRGQLLALYLVVANSALALGQVVFAATTPESASPFLAASALCSLSIVPLSLSMNPAPSYALADAGVPLRAVIGQVVKVAPLAPWTSIISGLGVSVVLGLGPLYGTRTGMGHGRVAAFVAVAMIGGVVLQWPLGLLSDRLPRRHVILGANVASAATAVVGWVAEPGTWQVFVAMFAFCAVSFPLYSLAISHLNDLIEPASRTTASGVLVLTYGLGSVAGPLLGSLGLGYSTRSFWLALAVPHAGICPYIAYRLVKRRTIVERWHHQPIAPESSVVTAVLVDLAAPPAGSEADAHLAS